MHAYGDEVLKSFTSNVIARHTYGDDLVKHLMAISFSSIHVQGSRQAYK